jgi:hypothetical protein
MVDKKGLKLFTGFGALQGTIDRFNGIAIANDKIIDDLLKPEQFSLTLANSLKVYEAQGFRGIWLKL